MKSFFAKDAALKIISFIISIILWIYIIAVIDPAVDVTVRDIPIQYIEQIKLADKGLSVLDYNKPTVEVKIRGSRKRLAKLDAKNVAATVDLSSVTEIGTHSLPVNITVPYEYQEVIFKKPSVVDVTVDKIVEERKNIEIIAKNGLKSGYIAGDIKVTPSSVLLKGASAIVNQVSSAKVELDYAESSADIYQSAKIMLFDSAGQLLESDNRLYQDVTSVDLYCPVMELKTVPVKVRYTGYLPGNIDSDDVKFTVIPSAVTIYAESDVVRNIDSISTLEVPLNNIRRTTETTVDLQIPDNISMRDDVRKVTVKIEFPE